MKQFKTLRRDTFEVNWGTVEMGDHYVQIYKDDSVLIDSLLGYVLGGLRAGEGVIVIGTSFHRELLEQQLFDSHAVDVKSKGMKERYVALDAEKTLAKFMVKGMPDEKLFRQCIGTLLEKMHKSGRKVRAFGEMVVLLWEDGHPEATLRLEQLWHGLCQEKNLALFCAYPQYSFTAETEKALEVICESHSHVVLS